MPQNDSWQYQGRQAHGRFGNGTKPWTEGGTQTMPARPSPLAHRVAAFARREAAQSMGMPSGPGPTKAEIDAAARYLTGQFGRLLEAVGIEPVTGSGALADQSWRSAGRWRFPSWRAPTQDVLVTPADPGDDEPKRQTGTLAKPGEATLSDDRREYILNGDGKGGGGHGPGRATPDKSSFPSDWSDEKTIDSIMDVANDPASDRVPLDQGRTQVEGTYDGLDITVFIGRDGKFIITAHPTNAPRNGVR